MPSRGGVYLPLSASWHRSGPRVASSRSPSGTASDGDVVLGFYQANGSCTPGTNPNCEAGSTSIALPNTSNNAIAFEVYGGAEQAILGQDDRSGTYGVEGLATSIGVQGFGN